MRTVLAVALLGFALSGSFATETPVELEWTDLEGEPFRVDALRGRVTVLNFWATWCKPCVEEMPDLEDIQARLGPLGVQVLGASADAPEQARAVRRFAKRHGISFPLVLGATTDQMEAVGLPPSLPGTVILDREGRIALRYPGVIDREVLEKVLRKILDGQPVAEEEKELAAEAPEDDEEEAGHDHPPDEAHDHGTSSKASLVPS